MYRVVLNILSWIWALWPSLRGVLTNLCLFVAGITSLFVNQFSVWYVAAVTLILITGLLSMGIILFPSRLRNAHDFLDFSSKYRAAGFKAISQKEFIAHAFQASNPVVCDDVEAETFGSRVFPYFNQRVGIPTTMAYLDKSSSSGPLPASLVAYSGPDRGWVFLATHPRDMSSINYFMALHELGHLQLAGIALKGMSGSFLLLPLLLAATMFPCLPISVWPGFALLVAGAMIMGYLNSRVVVRNAVFLDEVTADWYAFGRAPIAWLGHYPAERLADLLCGSSPRNGRGPLTLEMVAERKKLFAQNVDRVRQGLEPEVTRSRMVAKSLRKIRILWEFQDLFVISCAIYAGLHLSVDSFWQFMMIASVCLLVLFAGMVGHRVVRTMEYAAERQLAIGEYNGELEDTLSYMQAKLRT